MERLSARRPPAKDKSRIPEDKTKLFTIIDNFLSLSKALKLNFILGRRLGYYRRLSDLENSSAYTFIQNQVEKIQREEQQFRLLLSE